MDVQSSNEHMQQMHESVNKYVKKKSFPLRMMFELTYRCNFFCRHCYVPLSYRKKKELKKKEIFSIIDQLKDLGCSYLNFTGGEIFIRKDIIDILKYTKRSGFETTIFTNGSLINEKIADELAGLCPKLVKITIPAMTEKAYERITGVCGFRDKVFKAVELLYKKEVNLGFKTCLLKENKPEIKDIRDFASSLGALHEIHYTFSSRLDGSRFPFEYGDGRSSLSPFIPQSPKEKSADRFNSMDITTRAMNTKEPVDLFLCNAGRLRAAITPQGELKICVVIDAPKYRILEHSLKYAWRKLKKFIDSIKIDKNYKCDSCQRQRYCYWCPAKSWLYNRTFTSCDPASRKLAELRKQFQNSSVHSGRKES